MLRGSKVHIATSRPVGDRCIALAKSWGANLVGMDECDIFISVMYDKLIDEAFIGSKRRCVNFHPGLLPKYRGSGAYSWAIINGEDETGVTLHEIDVSIDNGPIIAQSKFDIYPIHTAGDLFRKAEEYILSMFQQYWNVILSGDYRTRPQDESKARIYYRRDLELQKDLTKYVRAFTFPGKESAYYRNLRGEKVYIPYEQL